MEATLRDTQANPMAVRREIRGAALFLAFAGLLHLYLAPQHVEHLGHALFLLLAGATEIAWALAYWRRPSPALNSLGIVITVASILLWGMTRVAPHPFGHGEVDVAGIVSKLAEAAALAELVAVAYLGTGPGRSGLRIRRTLLRPLGPALFGALVLYAAGLGAERAFPWLGGEAHAGGGLAAYEPDRLERLLTRSIELSETTSLEATYVPPSLLQALGEEVPAAALERPSAVFFILEFFHDHFIEPGPAPTGALLRLDNGAAIRPVEADILLDDMDFRRTRLVFPLPPDADPQRLMEEEHSLTLITTPGTDSETAFTWAFPLDLLAEPSEAVSHHGESDEVAVPAASAASQRLTRAREGLAYGGKDGIKVEATYATAAYFTAALAPDAATRLLPDEHIVFAFTERLHTGNLPASSPAMSLRLDGREYEPDISEPFAVSPHHRATLVRFPVAPPEGLEHHTMELRLADGASLVWHLPLSYAAAGAGFQLTWVSGLAVLGGLVAAMWPCLFQLTVFFIPALAGLSMQEARGGATLGRRFQVVKAAFFFVLGFTTVYTAGGALVGYAAQQLGDSPDFYVWQRYAALAGGIMIIILALRVAAKVRAPLVCKMPVLAGMAHSQKVASPFELMFAGLAFATGCMTCFGAAMIVAMVVYVGLAGSVAVGAMTMFLFSLGMGIPLVLAAIAMARVLPLLFRLERVVPWMGLASSALMVGFAVLLITGNYMVLTEWVYQAIPPVWG